MNHSTSLRFQMIPPDYLLFHVPILSMSLKDSVGPTAGGGRGAQGQSQESISQEAESLLYGDKTWHCKPLPCPEPSQPWDNETVGYSPCPTVAPTARFLARKWEQRGSTVQSLRAHSRDPGCLGSNPRCATSELCDPDGPPGSSAPVSSPEEQA